MKKYKRLILLLSSTMIFTLTGCETYNNNTQLDFERNAAHIDTSDDINSSSEYVNNGTNNKTMADYVNDGLEEAKANGLYHESDYSNIYTDNGTGISGSGTSNSGTSNSGASNSGTSNSGIANSSSSNSSSSNSDNSDVSQELTEKEIYLKRMTYLASLSYSDKPATEINENVPYFTADEIAFARNLAVNNSLLDNTSTFTEFSSLDGLKRSGKAYALLNQSMILNDDVIRNDISFIKPAGWVQAQYSWIDNGGWLYNRCHLIAWSLTGEDANEKNLMTGTRYFNTEGMLPYEIQVIQYLNENPKNHIMYRATPVYLGSELLARGLLLESYSIEDNGKLSFCVYIHNVQPGVDINYTTGESQMNEYMKILKKGDQKE